MPNVKKSSKNKEKTLIIVESPAKIKTISKILGSDYDIIASYGHIRDLPKKTIGIDINNNFTPKYEIQSDKKKYADAIIKAASKYNNILLATDPDREGEAISWHISQILPENAKYKRIVFNAIDRESIENAINNARDININLVHAQQARRILDRLYGYKGSAWLNSFFNSKNLSCGRVQSVALKIIVDKEHVIHKFEPQDYWNINVDFIDEDKRPIQATVHKVGQHLVESKKDSKAHYFLNSEEKTQKILDKINNRKKIEIKSISKKKIHKKPSAPYITSTLQQDASTKLGFGVAKTMQIAQNLYEGVDTLGGLITYMRTDSVRVSDVALKNLRQYISKNFNEFLSKNVIHYKSKKQSQDAHEAIRPTSVDVAPDTIKEFLSKEQYLLYDLIWRRYVASQMCDAVYASTSIIINIHCDDVVIEARSSCSFLESPGYKIIYVDDAESPDQSIAIQENSILKIKDLGMKKSTTRPPDRYSEASLVKQMEEAGVGRPSTYAPTISKISKYVAYNGKAMVPTEQGTKVIKVLDDNIPIITSSKFTSEMEDDLEKIEENKVKWVNVVENFWEKFNKMLSDAFIENKTVKERSDRTCKLCNAFMNEITWKNNKFLGCSNYPECKYSENLNSPSQENINNEDIPEWFDVSQECIKCNSKMKVRKGPYGLFLGCSNYPKCKNIISIPKKEDFIGKFCEDALCGGQIIRKETKKGSFYKCIKCNKIYKDLGN